MIELSQLPCWSQGVAKRDLYQKVDQEKKAALDRSYWFQKAWRGFVSSGNECCFLKRWSIKVLSVAALTLLPIGACLLSWGVYEIACTIIQTIKDDPTDPNNNYNTVGHIPEWVVAACVSLCVSVKIVQRCCNEEKYKTLLKLYQNFLSSADVADVHKSHLYKTALNELQKLEAHCLFSKHDLDMQINLLTKV